MKEETSVANEHTTTLHENLLPDYIQDNTIFDSLPMAAYVCDMSGAIKKYNEEAVKLWGRRPVVVGIDEQYCGAFRLCRTDGSWLPHEQTPAAACLKDGKPRKDIEVIIERPDLSRIY